jgi:ribosomal protein S18 acetylase RimI-like enzyme
VDLSERLAVAVVAVERARRAHLPGAETIEIDGLVTMPSPLADPSLSPTFVEREPGDAVTAVERARAELRTRRIGFGIGLAPGRHASVDAAVRRIGLRRLLVEPVMAAAASGLPRVPPPPGIEIRRVEGEDEVRALAEVDATAFATDAGVWLPFHRASTMHDGLRPLLAWEDGAAVGSALGTLHEGAVGVFGVGVLPPARRRGIGAALTAAAAAAFGPGPDVVWLPAATREAERLYAGLGFRIAGSWEVWVEPRADAPSSV